MISIGGVVLDDDLVWEDEFDTPAALQSVTPLLGGTNSFQTMAGDVPRTVTLIAVKDGDDIYGHFTRGQIKQLRVFEGGPAVTFVYEDQTLAVKILAGGIKVRPHLARPNQADEDFYSGTITMIEV